MGNFVPMQMSAIILLLLVLWRAMNPLGALVVAVAMLVLVLLQVYLSNKLRKARQKMQVASDRRLGLTSQLFEAIRVLKFLAIETAIKSQITEERQVELTHGLTVMRLRAASATVMYVLPSIATTSAFLALAAQDEIPDLVDTMVVLGAITMMRTPVSALPTTMSLLSECQASLSRLRSFFSLARESTPAARKESTDGNVHLTDCEFEWEENALGKLTTVNPAVREELREVSRDSLAAHTMVRVLRCEKLVIELGELCCVTGSVGSGKSSLCQALLGLMPLSSGRCDVGRTAYCGQVPWLMSASIRENIIVGHEYEEVAYRRAIRVAQLETDLKLLPSQDLCQIGEHGVNLSGGQRARISLARAVYRSNFADLIILDDVLAAVDGTVASKIMKELTTEPALLSKARLVVLSSHYELIELADSAVSMSQGVAVQYTNIEDYRASKHFYEAVQLDGGIKTNVDAAEPLSVKPDDSAPQIEEADANMAALYEPEERRAGLLAKETYASYLKAMDSGQGGASTKCRFVLLMILMLLTEAFRIGADVWLAFWAQDSLSLSTREYIGGLVGLTLGVCACSLARSLVFMSMASKAAENIHVSMLDSVTSASIPLFFDVIPSGDCLPD